MSCGICGARCQGGLCRDCEFMQRMDDEHEWRWDDIDDDLDDEDSVDRGDGVETDGGEVEWESPVPEAQAAAGADEVRVSLDIESTTSNGGMTADISDRVNRLYVESTTDRVIFEVCEEFDTVRASTTMTPDQAEAIGIGLMQAAARASRGREGVVIKKYNLAAVDRGEGIETDGGHINWPANFERTPASQRTSTTKFSISLTSSFSRLERSLKRIRVDDFDYEFDARQRQKDKRPYARASPDDPSFVVRWTKDGEQFAVACDHYTEFRDNVRAVGLYLEEKRKMENRPVATGESEFANARLPPADDDVVAAPRAAHEVLGVEPDASEEEVRDAFREAAKKRHPDKGGRLELFNELQEAKEAMLR